MTTLWRGRRLSRLMLGTVQFGMPYGVANQTGQPSSDDVLRMVAAAIDGGVNCFDTAAAYGASESVLGRALHELGKSDDVLIVTKVRALTSEQLADPALARAAITQSVEESRQRLRLDCLPLVLFHREADARYLDVLLDLAERGWLRDCGVSCDNRSGPALEFATDARVAALQIPGNVLDRRHAESGVFEASQKQEIAVFIRSVYLQGLLLLDAGSTPIGLQAVEPFRRQLREIASAAGLSLLELACRYMLSQGGVTSVLTGVETLAQVEENLQMLHRGPLPADALAAVDALTIDLPERILTPSQW